MCSIIRTLKICITLICIMIILYPETTNKLFKVHFEQSKNRFTCQFIDYDYENKSCFIMYGVINPNNQSCNIKNETGNSSDNTLVDTVTVSISAVQSELSAEFCFTAIGTTENYTIAVEGNFSKGTIKFC